jgi:hypothetical protein
MRKILKSSAMAAAVLLAACLVFLPGLGAAQQSDGDVTAILTGGQWRIMDGRRLVIMAFKPDGTFSSASTSAFPGYNRQLPSPAPDQTTGTWKIAGDKVILEFPDMHEQDIPLPINPGMVRMTDQNGMPKVMIRINSPPGWINQAPPTPAPAASSAPAVSSEDQRSASQIIQSYHDSLVFVSGSEGAGSGFIAAIGKANYLITNVHVVAEIRDAAFKTLDGTVVQGDPASVAVGEDICCMALPPGGKPFEIMQGVDANAAIGDEVVVLGNAEGAGVVNTIIGKIVGMGPNLVEIDAPFVPGNSGSPIVHLKTGKVIGVATYLITNQYDLTTKQKLTQPVIRRFGYRLDSVKGWQPVNWRAFDTQAALMDRVDKLTDDLYDFFKDLDEHNGVVTPARHTNPVIATRIDDWLAEKGTHPSEENADEANANFLSFLKIACRSDINAAQSQISYDYFLRDLADQKQTRDEMAKAFDQIIRGDRQ